MSAHRKRAHCNEPSATEGDAQLHKAWEFWERNKGREQPEAWTAGNTYTNHWDAPTYMLSVEDESLDGG
eukprot:scaffold26805_cov299-Cylindrotheca_fusiformis.AAC.1